MDPTVSSWKGNTLWQVVRLTNNFTTARDEIPVPAAMVLTYDQLMCGFLAFGPFKMPFKVTPSLPVLSFVV